MIQAALYWCILDPFSHCNARNDRSCRKSEMVVVDDETYHTLDLHVMR